MKRLLNPSFACLLMAVGVLVYGLRAPADEPSVRIENASGEVQLVNSKNGSAIFSASNLAPGRQVSGTVQLSNAGSSAGALDLTQADLVDTPGPGLGPLSGALQLSVRDVTNPAAPVTVFSGSATALGNRPLGSLAPGQSRTYAFTATLPASSSNSLRGSSMSVRYVWTLTGGDTNTGGGGTIGGGGTGGGTGGGGIAGGSLPAVSRMPVWTKINVKKARKKGLITVKLKCAEACKLSAYAAAKGKPAVRTRKKSGRAKARKWITIKLKLSKAGKRALAKRLKRKKSVPLSITIKAIDPRGASRTIVKKTKVKRR